MIELLTIFDTVLEHQLSPFLTSFPPRGDVTSRRPSTKFREVLIGLVQNGMLLLKAHSHWVFMRISMQPSAMMVIQYE